MYELVFCNGWYAWRVTYWFPVLMSFHMSLHRLPAYLGIFSGLLMTCMIAVLMVANVVFGVLSATFSMPGRDEIVSRLCWL